MGKRDLFWPAFIVYVVITGIDRFVCDVPNIIYIPVLILCLICFVISSKLSMKIIFGISPDETF